MFKYIHLHAYVYGVVCMFVCIHVTSDILKHSLNKNVAKDQRNQDGSKILHESLPNFAFLQYSVHVQNCLMYILNIRETNKRNGILEEEGGIYHY